MKTNIFLLVLSFSIFATSADAQSVKYRKVAIPKYDNMWFMAKDSTWYYYKTGENQITKFKIVKPTESISCKYKLKEDDKDLYPTNYIINGNVYVISDVSERNEDTKMKKSTYNIYKVNFDNGSIQDHIKFDINDSNKYYYYSSYDYNNKKFLIKRSDSTVKAYTLDLKSTDDFSESKEKFQPSVSFGIAESLANLFKSLKFSIDISFLGSADEKYKDSTSMDNYKVEYSRRKDEDIHFFKGTLSGVTITSKNPNNKVKNVEFSIDAEKSILDINYREDKNGRLILFGKYIIKGNSKSQYGMFSIIYDKDLNEQSNVKYIDLNNIYNITDNTEPGLKYVGFIFSRLTNHDYEFTFEESGMLAFTYQKTYNNIQDHIYILKVEENGQLTVQMIVNKMFPFKKTEVYEKHMALKSGNKLYILFYDNKENVGTDIMSLEGEVGSLSKKSTVLMMTTYDVVEDEFSKKEIIADKKTLVELPHLESPLVHFNTELNQYVCLLEGLDKKRNTVVFFEFLYGDK